MGKKAATLPTQNPNASANGRFGDRSTIETRTFGRPQVRRPDDATFAVQRVHRTLGAPMHFDAHQPIINDLEARITTIRDSL